MSEQANRIEAARQRWLSARGTATEQTAWRELVQAVGEAQRVGGDSHGR